MTARAVTLADGVAARAAREHRTGPQAMWGRPTARAVTLADGVWGQRRSAARTAREHRTGPQEI
jgi:hypothetical protein